MVQTGLGALAAIGGGFVGAWWQGQTQERIEHRRREERAADDQQQRRDGTSQVLAEIAALLIDLNILQLIFGNMVEASRDTFMKHQQKIEERHQALRVPLLTLAVSHPSANVRQAARDLEQALSDCLGRILYGALNPFDEDPEALAERAGDDYATCNRLFAELVEEV